MGGAELDIDLELLRDFEKGLDPRHPERSAIPASILGYGEISTVFEIGDDRQRGLAYKRLPVFRNGGEVRSYLAAYEEYHRLLSSEIGLRLPGYGHAVLDMPGRPPVVYLAQRRLDPRTIGNRVIHRVGADDAVRLVRQVLRELAGAWRFNRRQDRYQVGIDGQVSNWSVRGLDPASPRLPREIELLYLDTSTPLYREGGELRLDPELFLRSAPSFLVWLLRLLFLEDVVNRYFDLHLVAVDLVANFHKEQMPELIPALIEEANDFFSGEASDLEVEPLTAREVRSYYREDALIWRLYLAMRRTDRFLRTRLLRRGYPYILPGKIER
jgi:hypothetical protein